MWRNAYFTIWFVLLIAGAVFHFADLKVECSPLSKEVQQELAYWKEVQQELAYWADKMFDCGNKGYKKFTLEIGKNKGKNYLIVEIDKNEARGKKPVISWE